MAIGKAHKKNAVTNLKIRTMKLAARMKKAKKNRDTAIKTKVDTAKAFQGKKGFNPKYSFLPQRKVLQMLREVHEKPATKFSSASADKASAKTAESSPEKGAKPNMPSPAKIT